MLRKFITQQLILDISLGKWIMISWMLYTRKRETIWGIEGVLLTEGEIEEDEEEAAGGKMQPQALSTIQEVSG